MNFDLGHLVTWPPGVNITHETTWSVGLDPDINGTRRMQLTRIESQAELIASTTMDRMVKNTTTYQGAEYDEFRLLQPLWDLRLGYEDYVGSPLFPIFLSVGFYFLCMIPFTLLDLFGKDLTWVQRYKIQPDKEVTWPSIRKAIFLTLWNHLIFILPVSMAQWVWTPHIYLPAKAPDVWELCWQCISALAIFDMEYFIWHAMHHKIRFLYRNVHSIHHQYHAPHSWVTQYLHPWELVSVGLFTTTSPWFFDSHPLTQWAFQQFSIMVSVEAHIGYDFPGLPHRWFVLWGGSIKHDMHHQKPLSNYAPFFNYWDMICGSYCPGQTAGGHKPKALLQWEKDAANAKSEARRQRQSKTERALESTGNQHAKQS